MTVIRHNIIKISHNKKRPDGLPTSEHWIQLKLPNSNQLLNAGRRMNLIKHCV